MFMKKNNTRKIQTLGAIILLCGASGSFGVAKAATVSDEDLQALINRVNELEQQVKSLKQNQATNLTAAPVAPVVAETNRIDQLEQQVKSLQRNREVDQETINEKVKEIPTIALGLNGLAVRTADSNFVMYLHGYSQVDYRSYFGQKTTPDEFLLRRIRPIVEGSVWHDIDYRLMLDVATGNENGTTATGNNVNILDDAYVNAHYFKDFQVQIGKYKSPVGLERLQSTADLMFVETGFATQLTPNYDLGAEIHNDLWNSPIAYAVGVFNGASDNASDDAEPDEGKDLEGRLFAQPFLNKDGNPFQKLGFGAGASLGSHTSGTANFTTYRTPGQQTLFSYNTATVTANSGQQYRVDPQAYYFWGPFGLMGEYILSSQRFTTIGAGAPTSARFNNTAWQVEGSYFLTGEENSFKASSLKHVTPYRRLGFGEDTGWGAFEAVARIQQIDFDQNSFRRYGASAVPNFVTAGSAQQATAWAVGLNWYLNANLKLNLDYESTTFHGGYVSPGKGTSAPEHVILSRVQFQF